MKIARVLLVGLVLLIVIFTCVFSGSSVDEATYSNSVSSFDLTATFGAEEFHAQLTAIAVMDARGTPQAYSP